jgi:hypothetical protein
MLLRTLKVKDSDKCMFSGQVVNTYRTIIREHFNILLEATTASADMQLVYICI